MPPKGAMPRLYTLEQKIAFVTKVDQLLRAGLGKGAAAEAAGTSWASYTNWVQAGIRPAPAPCTPEEKARLVAAVQARVGEGMTVKVACETVGVTEDRYFRWRKQLAPPPPMRPVAVAGADVTALVPVAPAALAPVSTALTLAPPAIADAVAPPSTAGLCLVAPGGYRIEGLGIETAAALLRALA